MSTPSACRHALIDVVKTFQQGTQRIDAVRDVSLVIEEGSFVAVMGASGSGKSTLLHLMGGITRPSSGTVIVDGEDLGQLPDRRLTEFRRRRIGFVFQAFNLIPSLSAAENILLPLHASGAKERHSSSLACIADRLGIAHRLSHPPDSLSGGEQQRVAIARALITNPAMILADEPTGSVDSVTGQSICKLLRELCDEERRTLVVVTHEPSVAIWADRVITLQDGRMIQEFNTAEVGDARSLAVRYQSILDAANVSATAVPAASP